MPDAGAGSLCGINRPHQLRLRLDARRLQVLPLTPARSMWRLDIDRRPSAWVESLDNGPAGILHTLLLPAGTDRPRDDPSWNISGGLTAKIRDGGRSIAILDERGAAVLRYRDLEARDADGREVAARWERREGSGLLRLRIDAEGHEAPIRVTGRLVTAKGLAAERDAGFNTDPTNAFTSSTAPAVITPTAIAPSATGPPANDLCPSAEVVPATGPFPWLSAVHDLTGATTLGDPPLPSCQTNLSRSIWFSFTPAATGSYTLSLCNGATVTTVDDTVLAVYASSGDCAGFTELPTGCDDDSCGSGELRSVIPNLDLVAGTTYQIVAWQYGATVPAPGLGDVQLRVERDPEPAPAPLNDRCNNAELIPGAGPFPHLTTLILDVTGAGTVGDPPLPSCQTNLSRSVWYEFTPARAGRYTFSLCADAPTGTTLEDTVLAIYAATGSCTGLAQLDGGCDDDSCLLAAAQSVIRAITLAAGQRYYVVAWKYDLVRPPAGMTALQMRVTEELPPANDSCQAASPLALARPLAGTTVNAADDYRLPSGSSCFDGFAQTPSTAPGRDAVHRFTAPMSGRYSFRVTGYETTKNAVLYVTPDCPAGPPPVPVPSCLGAANRNSGYPAEEAVCLELAADASAWVVVDEAILTTGSRYLVEAVACIEESEPNDAPALAGVPLCGVEGAIDPAGEADYYALGRPPTGARLFAMVDGVAASSNDFDLRAVTAADTLEYDDLNNDVPFGALSPNLCGTPLPGGDAYLRVSHYSATERSRPYRLYAAIQPPASEAAPEVEPNGTPSTATAAASNWFAGGLSDTADVDLYAFTAAAGDLILIGLDLDPGRNATPFNGTLTLLDAAGAVLVAVNDSGLTSSTTPGTGSLAAVTPYSPGEAIAWRAAKDGIYYTRVGWSAGTPGDYLLSVARNCAAAPADADGDGVSDPADCAPADASVWAVPGEARDLRFPAPGDRTTLAWSAPAEPGGTTVLYDLLRSVRPDDFSLPACIAVGLTGTTAADPETPATAFFYLARSRNRCGGNPGLRSDGAPRTAGPCP